MADSKGLLMEHKNETAVSRQKASSQAQVRYVIGAAVAWAGIWIGTAVVLKERGGFADMIPILAIGSGWFIAVVPAQLATLDRVAATPERHVKPGA